MPLKIEVPASGGGYEALIKMSDGTEHLLCAGEHVDLWIHGGKRVDSITEMPAGTKAARNAEREVNIVGTTDLPQLNIITALADGAIVAATAVPA